MKKLPKVVNRSQKRVGRGYGSGRGGHTSGRGMKGQKARNKMGILFEGIKVRKSLLHRLPMHRGKEKFKAKPKPIIINLELLNLLPSGAKVDFETLAKNGIVNLKDAQEVGVKILGKGKLKKKLEIKVPISKAAAAKVKKAGGKIIETK